jgi:hypothetical protein
MADPQFCAETIAVNFKCSSRNGCFYLIRCRLRTLRHNTLSKPCADWPPPMSTRTVLDEDRKVTYRSQLLLACLVEQRDGYTVAVVCLAFCRLICLSFQHDVSMRLICCGDNDRLGNAELATFRIFT